MGGKKKGTGGKKRKEGGGIKVVKNDVERILNSTCTWFDALKRRNVLRLRQDKVQQSYEKDV